MSQPSRRFTDREVALILKRATEVDEADGAPGAGMSMDELACIAGEVGISRSAIERAAATLDRRGPLRPGLLGAPRVRKAVHAVPGALNAEGVARLVRLIDERADSAGAVTEALGSVRWTGSDRFKSTRVSITPTPGETSIEVVEKAEPRMRRIAHFLPAAWSAMLAAPLLASLQPSLPASLALTGAALLTGAGTGRLVWNGLSALSQRRVSTLAQGLAEEARALSETATTPSGQPKGGHPSGPDSAPEGGFGTMPVSS